jgi:hypothetical protein
VLGTARGLAQEVAGARLPVVATIGGHGLHLRGAELLRWKWVVPNYVAALYLPVSAAAGDPLADISKRITFRYQRGFTAAQLAEATTRTIGRGLDAAALAAIEPELTAFNQLYPSGERRCDDHRLSAGRWDGARSERRYPRLGSRGRLRPCALRPPAGRTRGRRRSQVGVARVTVISTW